MTTELQATTRLVVHECWSCGTVYAMSERVHNDRLSDGGSWYCPNGHSTVFKETEAARLARLLKNSEQTAKWERDHREAAERSLIATRGHVTRLRKKVLAGECPFCGQHLRDLERHISRQHKDEPAEEAAR